MQRLYALATGGVSLVKGLPASWNAGVAAPTISATTARIVGLILLAVILFRLPTLGFGILNPDESVYILLASGWKTGLLPYVDLIDRKPLGIFMIYGLAEGVFHNGVVGPRIFALLATFATSFMLFAFARKHLKVSVESAAVGGVLFSAYGMLFGGDAAQAPVFYMPLIAGAALLVTDALTDLVSGRPAGATRLGATGLLLGLALQIKYSVVIECIGFGGVIMAYGALAWPRLARITRQDLVAGLALMICGGLAPTIVVGAGYAAIGQFDAWYFCNFTSNFQRQSTDHSLFHTMRSAMLLSLAALPLMVAAGLYIAARRRDRFRDIRPAAGWVHGLLVIWFVTAMLDGFMLRQAYSHYFYGAIAPLAVLAGASLHRSFVNGLRSARIVVAILLGLAGAGYAGGWVHEIDNYGSPYLAYRMANDLRADRPQSLYVFNKYGILYYLAGQKLPTKYPMPEHVLRDLEARSFGFDGNTELTRMLDARPTVIAVALPFPENVGADRIATLNATLAANYCAWRTYEAGEHEVTLYRDITSKECGAFEIGNLALDNSATLLRIGTAHGS